MSRGLTVDTIRGFVYLSLGSGGKAIVQLSVLVVLARLLTPTDFGLIGLAQIVISFSRVFMDFGFGSAIIQKEEVSEIDTRTGFTFSILLGVLIYFVLWLISPIISDVFREERLVEILKVVSIVIIFNSYSSIAKGLLYRHMQYRTISTIEFISYTIGYGALGVILAYSGFGVWSLVFAVLGQGLLSTLLIVFFSKHTKKPLLNTTSLKVLSNYGAGYSLGIIFTHLGNFSDKIVVGRILGTEILGLYERSYQLVRFIASTLGEVTDKALFSPIARKQKDRKKIGTAYIELTSLVSFVFFPLGTFIYLNAYEIVYIMLGEQWLDSVEIVRIMALSLFFIISSRIGSTIAKALGDVYNRALRNFIFALLITIGAFIGTNWGIEGVSYAVFISFNINYIMAFSQAKRLTGFSFREFAKSHLDGLFLSVLFAAIYFSLNLIVLDYVFLNPFLTILINTFVFCLLFFLVIVVNPSPMIRKLRSRILIALNLKK